MINFAVKEVAQDTKLDGIRRLVMGITTAILAVYVVAVAGFFGWRYYWDERDKNKLEDLGGISEQVAAMANTEVLVRKLDNRVKITSEFMKSRPDVYKAAKNLDDPRVKVVSWTYAKETGQNAGLSGANVEILSEFSRELSGKYISAQINQSTWNKDIGWVSKVQLGGAI